MKKRFHPASRTVLLLVVAVIGWVMPGLVSPAQAQRFPFLIQPISIENLRELALELELSREQQAQMMQLYNRYQLEYEQLQERDVSDLVDDGLAMGQSMGSWWGGEVNIPPRKDVEGIVKTALEIYDRFNRIDQEYFDSINTLVIEQQLPALERARRHRKLYNYRMPHFLMASRMNEGIRFNLIDWVDRTELSPDELLAVRTVTDSFENRMLYLVVQFQSDLEQALVDVLDLIDELGLRDMDMQQMMSLMGQGLEDRLKTFFNEKSEAIQKTVEKMSRLNLQTATQLREIIGDDRWSEMTLDYADDSYSAGSAKRADRRFERAMKLETVTEDQVALLKAARQDYRVRWLGVFSQMADAMEDVRAYRTADQWEDEESHPKAERAIKMEERVDDVVQSGETSLAGILTDEQMKLMDGDKQDSGRRSRWSRSRSRGSGEGSQSSGGRTYSLPMAAMQPASVDQFSAWLGLEDVDANLLESLYDQYTASYEALSAEYDRRLTEGYSGIESGRNWRERRKVRRELQGELLPRLKEAEDAFFADMALVLPADTRPDLLDQIRISHDRARRRQKIWNGNWSLRGSTEGTIDIGEIVMAIDPASFDDEGREFMIDVLVEYNAVSMEDIDDLEKQYDRVRGLEEQLWGNGRDDLDEDLRSRLYSRWETGRSTMSGIAAKMSETNRSTYEAIIRTLPQDRVMVLQDMYERKAYPDVFKDSSVADEQIESTLALEDLTADQRERISDLALDYRSEYRDLTMAILDDAKNRQNVQRSWPPSSESMKRSMKMEQVRYRRRQLNDQTRIMLELILTDQQIALVPGLGQPIPDEQGS